MAYGYLDTPKEFAALNERERALHRELNNEELPDDSSALHHLKLSARCTDCGQMVFEVLPYGEDGAPICEACADKNPAQSEARWRERGGG